MRSGVTSAESEPLLILGARSFAREAADLVSDLPQFRVAGFVENVERERCAERIDERPVYWIDEIGGLASTHRVVCAFGSTKRRGLIERAEQMGFRFATLVHPSARVSTRSRLGDGCIVCPGAQVASGARLGRHVLVNRGALLGLEAEFGDVVTIGPGANVGGHGIVGDGCYIGMGAIVLERIRVGEGAVVAAGSVVNRDVPPRVLVAGMPAVVVQRGVDGL
jgi:sugar O-acyltransferase (sialic acid O-acetyltransferase NeuD family)